MYLLRFNEYYKIGRFVFGVTLFLTFYVADFFYSSTFLIIFIIIYCLASFFRLIFKQEINFFDFLFDIFFISTIVYLSLKDYSYFTLLYLFPIFFASLSLNTGRIYLFPLISTILYGVTLQVKGIPFKTDGIFNISLHCLSFFLIALSGDKLRSKILKQEEMIHELEESKLRMQGYERLYRISADLAHELRNPLTTISASVQFLKEGKNEKEIIEMIGLETDRLKSLINDFLFFSRPSDAPKEEVNLTEIIKTIIGYLNSEKNIVFNCPKNIITFANRTFLEVALNNIIKNAIEAAKSKIKISLEENLSEKTFFSQNRYVAIKIEDDGLGIENDIKRKIFEPFFTTKEKGTGLGLAIAHRIITEFGGNILVDKSDLGGAKFSIILPMLYSER